MKKSSAIHWIRFLPLTLALLAVSAHGQQTIANPLIRPANALRTQSVDAEAPVAGTQAVQQTEEMMRQAERRITQEDLNIRQQALNSPVVPAQLLNYFSNMQVTALLRGAVVLRRIEYAPGSVNSILQPVNTSTAGNSNSPARTETTGVDTRPTSRSTAVLRLREGQTVNVNGYPLRATVRGLDVSVDWLSEGGRWVNVYFGALESSLGGAAQVPSDAQLIEVNTDTYDYLVPVLTTRTFSSGGTLGGQGVGGQPNGFGGGFGGGQGNGFGGSQPGFGTGFPN